MFRPTRTLTFRGEAVRFHDDPDAQQMTRKVLSLVFLGLSLASGYVWYVQYFRWRGCFNEQGRCFDAEAGVVYSEQAGIVWVSFAVLAFGASLYLFWRERKVKR
ncbi:MAG: hypothetical protein RID23_19325 [Roseovarius sp.]